MEGLATPSDVYEDGYIPDMDLVNDLGGSGDTLALTEVTLMDVYHEQVVTNQLLGVLLALLIAWTIYGVGRTLYQLLAYHIFKHL